MSDIHTALIQGGFAVLGYVVMDEMLRRDLVGKFFSLLAFLIGLATRILAWRLKENTMATKKGKKREWRKYINFTLSEQQKKIFKEAISKGSYCENALTQAIGRGYKVSFNLDKDGYPVASIMGNFGSDEYLYSVGGFSGEDPMIALAHAFFYCDQVMDWVYEEGAEESRSFDW